MADVSPEAHPSSAADTLTRYSCAALVLSDSSAGCQLLRTFSPCPRFGCAAASAGVRWSRSAPVFTGGVVPKV